MLLISGTNIQRDFQNLIGFYTTTRDSDNVISVNILSITEIAELYI
jgi:hypothetical protein